MKKLTITNRQLFQKSIKRNSDIDIILSHVHVNDSSYNVGASRRVKSSLIEF